MSLLTVVCLDQVIDLNKASELLDVSVETITYSLKQFDQR